MFDKICIFCIHIQKVICCNDWEMCTLSDKQNKPGQSFLTNSINPMCQEWSWAYSVGSGPLTDRMERMGTTWCGCRIIPYIGKKNHCQGFQRHWSVIVHNSLLLNIAFEKKNRANMYILAFQNSTLWYVWFWICSFFFIYCAFSLMESWWRVGGVVQCVSLSFWKRGVRESLLKEIQRIVYNVLQYLIYLFIIFIACLPSSKWSSQG